MTCCGQSVTIINYGLGYGDFGLLLNLFLTGLVGSFTHCIGMCGPIALGQMSMRLMHLPKSQMSEQNKLLCAASVPYYIGKSLSYALLAISWFYLFSFASESNIAKLMGAIVMIFAALFFAASAFSINFRFLPKWGEVKFINAFAQKLTKIAKTYSADPFGMRGWIIGMLLGLIPCGLVYAAITTTLSYSNSPLIAGIAMFLFGLGTIPGLFLIAYFGENILIKWRKLFGVLYFFSMLLNAYLLLSAAWRYLSDFYNVVK